ncbi:hypothetical protein ACJ3XI_06940 [Litorimonas sp. RW-G-Af-16]|uniref:hypothetical protein n=1 Tax=Litorimonas sp. RW-G-Af-16 TaxID=3241168 RepID=UPI00390CB74C
MFRALQSQRLSQTLAQSFGGIFARLNPEPIKIEKTAQDMSQYSQVERSYIQANRRRRSRRMAGAAGSTIRSTWF